MDTLFGLPAHPFLVHIPVVLLPLAAIGVVVMAIRPSWYRSFRWVVLGIGAVGTLGIVLAASAGEELEARIVGVEGAGAAAGWEHHAELGETARNIALVFMVVLAAYVLVPWWLDRRRAAAGNASGDGATAGHAPASGSLRSRERGLRTGLAALAVVAGAACVVGVAYAGHTGSKSVWHDVVDAKPDGG